MLNKISTGFHILGTLCLPFNGPQDNNKIESQNPLHFHFQHSECFTPNFIIPHMYGGCNFNLSFKK